MFTGIVECLAQVKAIKEEKGNVTFSFESPISQELKIDQSVSHNGVCLTVIGLENGLYSVTAIEETLKKTNLGQLKVGDYVNLERCLSAHGRFDGHIVQGHVDTTGKCLEIKETNGSWLFTFWHPKQTGFITVEKGSICVNGTSLTVVDSKDDQFSVAIIPYTYENTVFKNLKNGDLINLEFDVIGKYVQKMMGLKNSQ